MSSLDFAKYQDAFERAVATFVQAFLSVFVVTDLSTVEVAAASGVAAALAVVKAAAKQRLAAK